MVNPQGTSFIPQRPTRGNTAPRKVRKIYVLAYLSYVLFFGSLLSAGGIFFMNFSLDLQREQQQQVLAAEKELFNEADIESIRDLEKRITIAEERLNNHVSVLAILEALEASAVQSLYFTSFTYSRPTTEFPTVVFSGTSENFNNVLFQREVFSTNPILAGSAFKEITVAAGPEDQGASRSVKFTLEKSVDTSLIGYTPRGAYAPTGQEEQQVEVPEEAVQVTTEEVPVEETTDIQ